MPIYDYILPTDGTNTSPLILQTLGPLILVEISTPDSLAQLFTVNNQPIPSSTIGWGVVDTGAFTTCVNKTILQRLGGQPVGTRQVQTPGANANLDVYPARISFPNTTMSRTFEEAIGMEDINSQYQNLPIIALIGREVLSSCILIYNGKTGIYTLTH